VASREEPVERTIQLTGGTTFTVSLPKEWASEHGVDAGDVVEVFSRPGHLLVRPASDRERSGVTIDAADAAPADLAWRVAAAYVAGCEEVRIESAPDREQRRAIREAIGGLVGFEVHAEDDSRLVARTMLDVGDLSPEQTLVQLQLTALSMHEAAVEALRDGDVERARRVVGQDDDVDRLFGLASREFHRSLVDVSVGRHEGAFTTFEYYAVARQLERVGDHAERIATVADRGAEPPEDVGEELAALAERSRAIVRRAVSGLIEGEPPATLAAVVADADEVVADAADLDRRLYEQSLADGYLLSTVLDSVVRTAEYGVNVAEAGLRARLRAASEGPVRTPVEGSQ